MEFNLPIRPLTPIFNSWHPVEASDSQNALSQTAELAQGKRYPLPEEWEAIKPILTQLYRDEDMKLGDVMTILSDKHNFHARRSMYLVRIRNWGLCKNIRAHEKEQIVELEDEYLNNNNSLPPPQILRGRAVRPEKINRYLRQKQRLLGSSEAADRCERQIASRRAMRSTRSKIRKAAADNFTNQMLIAGCASRPRAPLGGEDTLLQATRSYFDWFLDEAARSGMSAEDICNQGIPLNGSAAEMNCAGSFLGVFNLIDDGALELCNGYATDAWSKINRACANMGVLFYRRKPRDILMIIRLFCMPVWDDLVDLKSKILQFMISLTRLRVGKNHMLTLILSQLGSRSRDDYIFTSMQKVGVDMLHQSKFGKDVTWLKVIAYELVFIRVDDDYTDTHFRCIDGQLPLLLSSDRNYQYRAARNSYAHHLFLTRRPEAEPVLFEVLSADINSPDSNFDDVDRAAMWMLGKIYWKRKDYAKALEYRIKSFLIDLESGNDDKWAVLSDFAEIQDWLIILEDWNELRRFRETYSQLLQYMPNDLRELEIPDSQSSFCGSSSGSECSDESEVQDDALSASKIVEESVIVRSATQLQQQPANMEELRIPTETVFNEDKANRTEILEVYWDEFLVDMWSNETEGFNHQDMEMSSDFA